MVAPSSPDSFTRKCEPCSPWSRRQIRVLRVAAFGAEMNRSTFEIIERGTGQPVVLIPGIQGRWEYATATVEALARDCRVITFSLCDERTAASAPSSAASDRAPLDVFAEQVEQ